MPRALTDIQNAVLAKLIEKPYTSFEISDMLGLNDKSVKTALYALRDVHETAHIREYRPSARRQPMAVWAAGKGKDAKYAKAARPKKVAPPPDLDRSKLRVSEQMYINKHLQKQPTPFGWLLENAHGNDARG